MAGSSEEYLAALGFDTSDADKAVNQTITLLGHLGNQFDDVSKRSGRAERALSTVGQGGQKAAKATSAEVLKLNQSLYDQAEAYKRIQAAQKAADSNTRQMSSREREFADFIAAGEANDRYARSISARQQAQARDADITNRSAQARSSLTAQIRGEEQARRTELAALRSSIIARSEENRALDQSDGNLARLRYAVYDVSNALAVGGAASLAFTAGIVGTNVVFEREFADVRRTVGVTGAAANELYADFLRLSTEIPTSFSQLTQIGTLAGQLGVVEDRVESFTETVAQFSATTDVSVDASATAFGRLDQLIDGVDGRYKNLASSILNVGINSVATESQIIGIASQIAATGNQAGLTADEVIGLAGSLASLGVAPEAARGTVLRVFSQINAAISEGGERLSDYSAISNMTADDFRKNWSTDFTTTFLAFLRGIDANGSSAEATLRSLGITAARDVNAMLKLSQNADSVQKNLALAATGFGDASILADNFGIIAETNSARIQRLIQTVQALAASAGAATSGPLAGFLAYLQRLLDALTAFTNTPIGQGIAGLATILGGVLAVMLLLSAVALRGAGSFLALKTALGDTYLQTMLAQGGMRGFTASLFGAAGGAAALSAALKATGVGLLITAGLYLLGEAVGRIGGLMQSGADKAEAYFGSLDGLSDAIKADNAAVFAQQLEQVNGALSGSAEEGGSWIDVLTSAAEAQALLKSQTEAAGGAIDEQTLRIGTNTQEWLRNALSQSEAFQSLFTDLEQLKALTGSDSFTAGGMTVDYQAFDLERYVQIATTQGTGAAMAFLDSWRTGLEDAFAAGGAADPVALVTQTFGGRGSGELGKIVEAGQAIGDAVTEGISLAASGDAQSALLDAVLGPLEEGADAAADTFRTLMDDVYGVINAENELSNATFKLGEDFATNGAQVAASGDTMQSVIASIFASSSGAPEAAARMQGLFDALVAGGYASAAQLAPLQSIINSLAGGNAVKAAAFDMGQFSAGIDKVAQSATKKNGGGAAKAIRTLVDYANDLRSVFSRAFEIRFGGSQAADDITSSWNSIRKAIADVNEEIRDYQTEMQSLSADRDIREYWLRVAENYGDALRAGALRAEIGEIDAKLAKAANGLSSAQQKNSKTLVGNSEAAIENRSEILGLVEGYQTYLSTLAAAGVPQAQLQEEARRLQQDFIAQATQLGYNSEELRVYAAQFDSVATAIARVPRNITITSNVDPALQAIAELEAKARSVGGQTYAGPTIGAGRIDNTAAEKLARQAKLISELNNLTSSASMSQIPYSYRKSRIEEIERALATGSYRSGTGWTGSGNPWDVAGVVHNREAVLNERGTQAVGSQFVNAANQGRNPWQYGPSSSSKVDFPRTMVVEFSPVDRELIASGAAVTVIISGDKIAGAAGAANEDDSRRGGG